MELGLRHLSAVAGIFHNLTRSSDLRGAIRTCRRGTGQSGSGGGPEKSVVPIHRGIPRRFTWSGSPKNAKSRLTSGFIRMRKCEPLDHAGGFCLIRADSRQRRCHLRQIGEHTERSFSRGATIAQDIFDDGSFGKLALLQLNENRGILLFWSRSCQPSALYRAFLGNISPIRALNEELLLKLGGIETNWPRMPVRF
jgi:hypothetical protein